MPQKSKNTLSKKENKHSHSTLDIYISCAMLSTSAIWNQQMAIKMNSLTSLIYCFLSRLFSYNILIIIVTYCLPIVSMTVTYSRVGIELWGSKTIGEYTPRQVENVRSKRRVSE